MDIERAQESGKSIARFSDPDERFLFGWYTPVEVPALIGQGHKTVHFDATPPTPLDLFRTTSSYFNRQRKACEENAVKTYEEPVEVTDEQLRGLATRLSEFQGFGPDRLVKARNMAMVITEYVAERAAEAVEALQA